MGRWVRWLQRALVIVGVVALTAGILGGVVHREVVDGNRFAHHVDAIRTDPDVARQLGLVVTERVLDQQPELVALRPLIESAAEAIVASPSLGPVVEATVRPLHRAIVSGGDDQVVLRLADVGALLVAAIRALDPDAHAAIPSNLDVTLAAIGSQELTADVISAAHTVTVLSWLLPLLGLACLTGVALWRARQRGTGGGRVVVGQLRRALVAVVFVLVGMLLLGTIAVGRLQTDSLSGALLTALWHELDGGLVRPMLVLGVAAVVLAVMDRPTMTLDPRTWGVALASTDRPSGLSSPARALALLAGGLVLVVQPTAVVTVVAVAAGVVLIVVAVRDLLLWLLAWLRDSAPDLVSRVRPVGRAVVPMAVAAVVLTVLVVGAWPRESELAMAAADGDDRCNGHVELCERPYDQVAFPATHNSMSAADAPGWYLAEQPTGVMGQLDDGIRVFLIDSWPGQTTPQPGIVANSAASRAAAVAQADAAFGSSIVEAAKRLRESLSLTPQGEVTPYLCHALCELGATEWTPLMQEVRVWMEAHPREVITFFIQDEVSPADTAKVFEQAGLMPFIHEQAPVEPWPTLAEMIDAGERLVVLHEHTVDPAVPWILDGAQWVQDTPYTFHAADEFTCDLLRGPADAPLFLVNHWLSNQATRIADAEVVNSYPVLSERLERCRDERQMPNFVAVDNYDRGDVLSAVDAINGLD
ncbi:hypothetical protein [Pseudactinotalea sp.]|uniref:hypothetical protein n=1 Tax=Pseudactinotalea sp. TaxID=1926260 RepID=UPI003B3A61C8